MNIKKDVFLATFLALAIVLSILESFIPIFNNVIPGLKLGFANIMILLALYLYTWKDSILISILRVILVGILRTGLFTLNFYFSFFGALLSIIMMGVFKRSKLSIIGVSIIGSISHSIGQILVAMLFLKTSGVLYYLPYLTIFSLISGIIIGYISKELLKQLKQDCIFD